MLLHINSPAKALWVCTPLCISSNTPCDQKNIPTDMLNQPIILCPEIESINKGLPSTLPVLVYAGCWGEDLRVLVSSGLGLLAQPALAAQRVWSGFPCERPRLSKHPHTSRGLSSVLRSWEAADLKAISEHVIIKKMIAGRVIDVLTFFPKDCTPEEPECFLFFFFHRISLKNVSSSPLFSHLFLFPVPHWDVSQFQNCMQFPLEAISTNFKS